MGCCPGKMPSITSMAKDFSNTAVAAMRMAMRNGNVLTSADIVKTRLAACDKCESKQGLRCLKCGCYINMKTAVAAATCPDGKW